MSVYKIKTSEIMGEAVKVVELDDGRRIKKVTDKRILKRDRSDIRSYVQLLFFLITLWIGVDFYLFVSTLEKGTVPTVVRPPGVEGFLPISSLMSFRYFVLTGVINHIHPAGFFIFIAVLLVSVFMKKGFCSWICPVGYVSEGLFQLGERIFGRNFTLPKWIDVPLRSVKYILLAFFLISVSILSVQELDAFIHSGFNKVADIKLYVFFAHISLFSLVVIVALMVFSLFYKNFWCRYACPYGALLGIASLVSPLKIRREEKTCIDCGLCSKACPSMLPVDKLGQVNSAECTACYACVEACPIKDTLNMSLTSGRRGLSQRQYAVLLAGVYFGIVGLAMLVGLWHNSITPREYLQLFRNIGSIGHVF